MKGNDLTKPKGKNTIKASYSYRKIIFILIVIGFSLVNNGCSSESGLDLISMDEDGLKALLKKTPASTLKVDIFYELAYRHSWDGEEKWDEGEKPLEVANSAKNLAIKLNYPKGQVDAFCILGQIHFLNGDFDKSKEWYEKGMELAKEIKYRTGEAMANNGIGRYHQVRGEFPAALENFLKSEELCKSSIDQSSKRAIAAAYYGLGAIYYYDPADYQEAKRYFDKFLILGKEINDDIIITSGYYTIGEMYLGLGNYEEARKKFKVCLRRSKKIGLIYNQANANEGLADMFFGIHCYYIALHYYNESLKLFSITGNRFQIAEIKRRLGRLYNKLGEVEHSKENYEKAFKYLDEALEFAKSAEIPKSIEGACEEIIKSCIELGKKNKASDYYKLLIETKKFLRKNEMVQFKSIRDSEKKAEKERIRRFWLVIGFIFLFIVLLVVLWKSIILRKQKNEIEKQTIKLSEALIKEKQISDHKDDLMHTVSHQYKTPLAVIDSSAQILKNYLSKLSGREIEEHVDKILLNLKKMTDLIDPLLKFGKKFAPSYYDLNQICKDFTEKIKSDEGIEHIIEFKSPGDCVKVKLDKDFMNIILSNLLNNSIKYSPGGSKVIVELLCDHDFAVIKVIDQGIGIPSDYMDMRFERFHRGSNVGTVPGTGLGLAIVKRYTDLHGGNIYIETKLNAGTTVTVKIPKT
jgi:signal transduction histidine kinase